MASSTERTTTRAPSPSLSVFRPSARQVAVAAWGLTGILGLLAMAIGRLSPLALEALLSSGLSAVHWAALGVWVPAMAAMEGYRGFQTSYSPRVVARAFHVGRHGGPWMTAIAPLFCMTLFHARRRTLVVAWSVLLGVGGLVLLVRLIAQPWRGIIDAGVVVGLTWGALSIIALFVRAWRVPHRFAGDPALPER